MPAQKCTYHVTFDLDIEHSCIRADLETILCKFGRNVAICVVVEAICAKKLTDGQTDETTDAARLY